MGTPLDTRRHASVRRLRGIRDGEDKSLLFAEGPRLAEELLASPLLPAEIFCTTSFEAKNQPLMARLAATPGAKLERLTETVMDFVSDLDAPPGLIVLASRPAPPRLEDLLAGAPPLLVVLARLQLPSNVGAVMRAAEAAGVRALLATRDTADPLGPKALRASAGSAFRLPASTGWDAAELYAALSAAGVQVLAADAKAEKRFDEIDWTKPSALVMGAEGGGLARGAWPEGLACVNIPMAGKVESLNVAVASGIILHQAFRMRNKR